jgi:transposase
METGASEALFAGLDLHSSNVWCGIVDGEGRRVFGKRLGADLGLVLGELEPYRQRLKAVTVESTYNWYWLVDGLLAAGYAVRLANPARTSRYEALKVSTDRSEAFWLAEMLRLGILPEGYIYPKEIRPVRDMLRRRGLIVRQRTQIVLSLQSMVARQTGRQIGGGTLRRWALPEIEEFFEDRWSRQTARSMVELIRSHDAHEQELNGQVLERVKLFGPYKNLLGVPGIGRVLAVTIMLETGPIERFASAGHYASYCRMVQSRRESNRKNKGENNRKNGNKYLGWAFVEAANFAQRYNRVAQGWFDRKRARGGRALAVKALGCKMSKAVFYILRDGVAFDLKLMFG